MQTPGIKITFNARHCAPVFARTPGSVPPPLDLPLLPLKSSADEQAWLLVPFSRTGLDSPPLFPTPAMPAL